MNVNITLKYHPIRGIKSEQYTFLYRNIVNYNVYIKRLNNFLP